MLTALNDRVIVRPDELLERTNSGTIIIPDAAKDGIVTRYGTVLSVGPLCTQVVIGTHVMYNKYHGLEAEYKGEVLLAIRESELLGVDDDNPNAKLTLPSEQLKALAATDTKLAAK